MRLIDADALKQQLVTTAIVNNPDLKIANEICKVVDTRPTVYDAEKVVREVKDFEEEAEQFGVSGMLADIIEVIETGGVE